MRSSSATTGSACHTDRIAVAAVIDRSAAGHPEPLSIYQAAEFSGAACSRRIEELRVT